jgi:hypothetical protein
MSIALWREGVLLREPRTTKSFRDAGDRIVRQEAAVSPSISGLLSAPSLAVRGPVSDAEAWDVRLAALAMLGQYDGLAFVPHGHADVAAPYNLMDGTLSEPTIREAVEQTTSSGTTVQLRASVRLADGRMTSAVLVTPLAPSETFAGALVAFRVGRPFAAVDTYTAVGIAELVSLELARSLSARREATERRQAFVLYELARHALFGEDLDETLSSIAMVLATALDHEAAHVWLRRPDRSLRRHAAYPVDRAAPEVLWENEDNALYGALHERRLVRMSSADVPWIPSSTGQVLVAPLRSDPRPLGVLVLARGDTPYGLDDIEMADLLGTFVGRVVASAQRASAPMRQADAVEPAMDLEREGVLAESQRN